MASLEQFDEKLSAIEKAVETTAVEVSAIDADVTWLKEALTHTTEGLTVAQEFEVLQRLDALGARVAAVRDAVAAVDDRTPPRAEPEPQPETKPVEGDGDAAVHEAVDETGSNPDVFEPGADTE